MILDEIDRRYAPPAVKSPLQLISTQDLPRAPVSGPPTVQTWPQLQTMDRCRLQRPHEGKTGSGQEKVIVLTALVGLSIRDRGVRSSRGRQDHQRVLRFLLHCTEGLLHSERTQRTG